MVKIQNTVFCDGCGVEIPLSPVIKNHGEYCCEDCAQGYECDCAKQMELDEEPGSAEDSGLSTYGAV